MMPVFWIEAGSIILIVIGLLECLRRIRRLEKKLNRWIIETVERRLNEAGKPR